MISSKLLINSYHYLKTHFLVVVFLLFYLGITTYKLISSPTPFYDWDESIYAQVGREMVREKSFIPLWQGQFWLDKPPLVPLVYGIIETLFPVTPEISTRVFTLLLAIIILGLCYIFYYRLTKNVGIALLTIIITSFTPIFLQRSQVLNVDIFLFLGWMGYLVFYSNFWISLFFLGIGVMSKSLLGFYPIIGFFCVYSLQLYLKKIKWKNYQELVKKLFLQGLIFAFWYIVMLLIFKMPFIQAHFIDSHLKRVTASIESHFGQRTFYIDLLFGELTFLIPLSIISICILIFNWFKKKDTIIPILSMFFVPWFLFLNLTKTKIHWYLYPVIPQFVFLGLYMLNFLKKYSVVLMILTLSFGGYVIYNNVINGPFFSTHYSSYDDYYYIAQYIKKNCSDASILVDQNSRNSFSTLKNMNLLIGTSDWWGNHPSLVYYSDKKIKFIYTIKKFDFLFQNANNRQCFVIDMKEIPLTQINSYTVEKKINDITVLTKP